MCCANVLCPVKTLVLFQRKLLYQYNYEQKSISLSDFFEILSESQALRSSETQHNIVKFDEWKYEGAKLE